MLVRKIKLEFSKPLVQSNDQQFKKEDKAWLTTLNLFSTLTEKSK